MYLWLQGVWQSLKSLFQKPKREQKIESCKIYKDIPNSKEIITILFHKYKTTNIVKLLQNNAIVITFILQENMLNLTQSTKVYTFT